MSMNKQFKVTFNVTATLSDAQEEALVEGLHELAKDLDHPVYFDSILIAALTHGPEGAFTQAVKQGLRRTIKELYNDRAQTTEYGVKFSPAQVEVIR